MVPLSALALSPEGNLEALLRLSLSEGWGPIRIREGLERRGSAAALLAEARRLGPLSSPDQVDSVLSACRTAGVTAMPLDASSYPECLRHLPDPPPVLFFRGELGVLGRRRAVIVGSREATAYGRRAAEMLAGEAVGAGWVVVSGLALGVDGAAHRGALDAGGVSVAVLGSGPDRPTPRTHLRLADRLLDRGCLLSELPPGAPARAHHFPRRNRLLAALGTKVVVVEAGPKSGALITARIALELGRDVWAVPGSVFSPVCEGVHLLLDDGARPVVNRTRWREALRGGADETGSGSPGPRPSRSWDEGTRAVWLALRGGARTLEDLLSDEALQGMDVLPALTLLELGGWVWRGPAGDFQRRVA